MQGARKDRLSYLPLALALVVAGLLVVVLSSDYSPTGTATASPQESRAVRRTEALLAGIPQHGAVLGSPKAPVTLQFFGDLQCSESRQVMLGALPFLIRHWVRGDKLRIVYRSTMADTPDWPEFREQQIAALVAGRQDKMWTFVDLFYREQRPEFTRYADDAFLEGIAEQAGVNMWSWAEDRESESWAGRIESDEVMAGNEGANSTPSFAIGPTGGDAHPLRHFSLEETQVFDDAIKGVL
jgi:protein-disulfide isomerase